MSSKLSKNGAYEILIAQKDAITKITGIITPKSIDTLENELAEAFTIQKSTHFAEGERYRYLACIIPEEKYCIIIVDPTWVYAAPVKSRCIRSCSPGSRSEHSPSRIDHRATQGNAGGMHRVSRRTRSREGTSSVWHRR
jgi:hypothetical protein